MLEKIRGIVLRTVKFSDQKLILDLFTWEYGRKSFVTKITRSRHVGSSGAFWSPLSMVEFQADCRPGSSLPKPKDVRIYQPYTDIPFSPVKQTIVMFLAEFLAAALREEKENQPLYNFLESSLQWLDAAPTARSYANFHLVFMMRMTLFIGFYPNLEKPTECFDLCTGTYADQIPAHTNYIIREEAHRLPLLFRLNYATMYLYRMTSAERKRTIEVLNTYYRLHVPNFPELKSLEVLHEVFSAN